MKLSSLVFTAAIAFASAAHAVPINGSVAVGTPFNSSASVGLPVFALDRSPSFTPDPNDPENFIPGPRPPFTSQLLSFDLVNVGDTLTTDVFVVTTGDTNTGLNPVDSDPQPFSLIFLLNSLMATVHGTTSGLSDGGNSFGFIDFQDAGLLDLGNGLAVSISLTDGRFNQGAGTSFTPGENNGRSVSATFELVNRVPEPGTLPLVASALGLLALSCGRAAKRRLHHS